MRKINLVKQATRLSCGPACISMLTGIPEKEVITLVRSHYDYNCGLTSDNMLLVLKELGINCDDRWLKDGLWCYSPKALLRLTYFYYPNGKYRIYGHFLIYYNKRYYDPGTGVRGELFHPSYAHDWIKVYEYLDIFE